VSRACALLAAALAAAPGAASAEAGEGRGETALCEASVSLDPVRAHPGEQVFYRLRLLVRDDVSDASFELPPSFPGLRAERLVPEPAAGPVLRGGSVYHVRDDARALFADRPGTVAIPPASLLCRTRGPAGEVAERLATPAATLEIAPLPEVSRPAGFEGLVGPLSLRRLVTPESVALGRSVRLAVTLQGAGNLWDAPEPVLSAEALGGAELFRRSADVELDRGTRLLVRRRFVFDLVPRREGVLEIPALAFAYYDPVAGRYAEATAEAVRVTVGPPAAPSASDAGHAEPLRSAAQPASAHPGRTRIALGVAGAALLLAALGAAGLRWGRRRERSQRVGQALARAEAARAAGDRDAELAGLARALRIALAARSQEGAEGPVEAIPPAHLAPASRAALELLAALERARFDPATPAPDRAAVLRSLAAFGMRGEARGPR
jgi:hypothetical protein